MSQVFISSYFFPLLHSHFLFLTFVLSCVSPFPLFLQSPRHVTFFLLSSIHLFLSFSIFIPLLLFPFRSSFSSFFLLLLSILFYYPIHVSSLVLLSTFVLLHSFLLSFALTPLICNFRFFHLNRPVYLHWFAFVNIFSSVLFIFPLSLLPYYMFLKFPWVSVFLALVSFNLYLFPFFFGIISPFVYFPYLLRLKSLLLHYPSNFYFILTAFLFPVFRSLIFFSVFLHFPFRCYFFLLFHTFGASNNNCIVRNPHFVLLNSSNLYFVRPFWSLISNYV